MQTCITRVNKIVQLKSNLTAKKLSRFLTHTKRDQSLVRNEERYMDMPKT